MEFDISVELHQNDSKTSRNSFFDEIIRPKPLYQDNDTVGSTTCDSINLYIIYMYIFMFYFRELSFTVMKRMKAYLFMIVLLTLVTIRSLIFFIRRWLYALPFTVEPCRATR